MKRTVRDIVSLIITDAFNCTAINAGIGITVNPLPNATITRNDLDTIICSNDVVDDTATGENVFTCYVDAI